MASSAWIVAAKLYETNRLLQPIMCDVHSVFAAQLMNVHRRNFWRCINTEPMLIDFGWRYWNVPQPDIATTWCWRSALTPSAPAQP